MTVKKKILIIEDEQDMRRALKIRLEANGYEVSESDEGLAGLSLARQEKPDLVVLDIMLPKMDGFKVCRMLKFDEAHKTTPIIILTAKVQQADVEKGLACGADAYMTKPYKAEELLAKIKDLLK